MRETPIIDELTLKLDSVKQQLCDLISSTNIPAKLDELGEACLKSLSYMSFSYTGVMPPCGNDVTPDVSQTSAAPQPKINATTTTVCTPVTQALKQGVTKEQIGNITTLVIS